MLAVSSNVEQRRRHSTGEERRRTDSVQTWEEALRRPVAASSRKIRIGTSRTLEAEELTNLSWRQKLLLILEEPSYGLTARLVSYCMLLTICGTICFFVLEAEPSMADWEGFFVMEILSTAIFTVEYALRLLSCTAFGDSRWHFMRTPMNVLDVVAILPFYVELLSQSVAVGPLAVLRSVRLIRIFRIFRLSKYSMGMSVMIHSLAASVQPLIILLFFLCIGGTLFSSLVYYAEKMYCPAIANMSAAEFANHRKECQNSYFDFQGYRCCDEFGAAVEFSSIMDSTWWCVVTMTTVGYGDKVPATKLGQLVGGLTILSGIVLISLPVAIVGSRFQTAYEDADLERQRVALEEKDMAAEETEGHQKPYSERVMKRLTSPASPEESRRSTERTMSAKRTASLRKQQSTKSRADSKGSRKHAGTTISGEDVDSEECQSATMMAMADTLKDDLERLRRTSNLTGATREQIRLLLALLENVGTTEDRLQKLKEKDAHMEARLNSSFSSLCRRHEEMKRLDKTRTT